MNLSRRTFLRILGLSSLAGGLAACGVRNRPTPIPPDITPLPSSTITINGGNAEVWAWNKTVRGTVDGQICDSVTLHAGELSVQAVVEGNTFTAEMPLQAGNNRVYASCAGVGVTEPRIYQVRLRNVPRSNIQITVQEDGILLDSSTSEEAPQESTPISERLWTARAGNPSPVAVQSSSGTSGSTLEQPVNAETITLEIPQVDGEYYIQLTVRDESGREDTSATYFVVEDGQPRLDDWATENTDWVESAVVYGVIPRNFGNKSFQAITERLDALQDLGVTALWLGPIHPSPAYDYGYAVKNYFELNESFGTEDEFREMVQQAHQRGIRVLMDLVPNHSSNEHRYYYDTERNGQDSHQWDFYDRNANGEPTHYFNWTNLPNLNYDNPEVEAWMIEASSYWVREFDIDGYRVDVAWGIKERKPDFWPKWRAALKRIKPDVLLLAEATAREEYYFTNGFDAAYDWTGQLGNWAWESAFESKPDLFTYNLTAALTNGNTGFHPDALVFHFLNNNDTQRRFISKYGIETLKVSTTMLLTLPGLPCVYTGDEVGEEFLPYGDPQPLSFTDRHGLFDFHKQLIHLRRENPALHSRQWHLLDVVPHQQIIGYLRYTEDSQTAPVLVLLNFFDQPQEVEVTLPDGFTDFFSSSLVDLQTGQTVAVNDGKIPIEPYGTLILSPQA